MQPFISLEVETSHHVCVKKSDDGNTRSEFHELKVKKEILDENTNGTQKKSEGYPEMPCVLLSLASLSAFQLS